MIEVSITEGDHINPVLAGAEFSNVQQDMGDPGWTCRFSVTRNGKYLIQDRDVTDLVPVLDGAVAIDRFRVALTAADTALLEAKGCGTEYVWTIRVSNLTIPDFYSEESKICITVEPGFVSV